MDLACNNFYYYGILMVKERHLKISLKKSGSGIGAEIGPVPTASSRTKALLSLLSALLSLLSALSMFAFVLSFGLQWQHPVEEGRTFPCLGVPTSEEKYFSDPLPAL